LNKWLALTFLTIGFLSIFALAFFLAPSQDSSSLSEGESEEVPEANGNIGNLYVYVEEEDLDSLYNRDVSDDQRVAAAVAVDNDSTEHATEFRFRGNSSRGLPKKSLSLRFDSPKDFIFGAAHMNLNAMYTDPSMMREKIAFDMFHDLGLPAPRTKYFNLYINGVFEGLYVHIERIDEYMLPQLGLNPRGTLVRDEFRHNQQLENVESSSIFSFDIRTAENKQEFLEQTTSYRNKPDWEEFAELLEWIYQTEPGPEFAVGMGERVELDALIDWMVIHFLVADVDAFADDYWLYLDHLNKDSKWLLIPWDKDLSFGSHYRAGAGTGNHYFAYESPVQSRFGNQLLGKFLNTPELRTQLNERMQYLMTETFTPQYFEDKITELTAILEWNGEHTAEESFVLHRKNSMGESGFEDYYKENILDFVELRYQYLAQYLEGFGQEENKAVLDVSNAVNGDVLYFRDQKGWVIGKMEVEDVRNAETVSISIRQDDLSPEIDRVWTVETTGGALTGNLTLYYRNDTGWIGKENWYYEDTPTGEQWDLQLAEIDEAGMAKPIRSYVNPFSNKLTSEEAIELNGTQDFIIKKP
jgi:spore coat protein H